MRLSVGNYRIIRSEHLYYTIFFVYNIPGVDLIMEYIYMRIAVRKWGTSYINPASLLNITPEIVDRLLNT
jgi:hypothetical protein